MKNLRAFVSGDAHPNMTLREGEYMGELLEKFKKMKYGFWALLILVPLVAFGGGYGITAGALWLSGHAAAPEETTEEVTTEPIIVLAQGSVQLESRPLYFLQLSSLTAADGADQSVAYFKQQDIEALWYHSGTQYRVFTAMSVNETVLNNYRRDFVTVHSGNSDAFVSSSEANFNAFDFVATDEEVAKIQSLFSDFYETFGVATVELVASESSASETLIEGALTPLQEMLDVLNQYPENIDKKITLFLTSALNQYQTLLENGSTPEAFNRAYTEQMLFMSDLEYSSTDFSELLRD
jgi:hypothetical protein